MIDWYLAANNIVFVKKRTKKQKRDREKIENRISERQLKCGQPHFNYSSLARNATYNELVEAATSLTPLAQEKMCLYLVDYDAKNASNPPYISPFLPICFFKWERRRVTK